MVPQTMSCVRRCVTQECNFLDVSYCRKMHMWVRDRYNRNIINGVETTNYIAFCFKYIHPTNLNIIYIMLASKLRPKSNTDNKPF